MKKLLLSALLLSCGFAQAQITPAEVTSPMAMSQLYVDFPGMRPGFTLMKLRLPSFSGTGETTWYDFVPAYNASKVVNGFAFNSIDPGNPLEEETRLKSTTPNGNSYTYVIELNDVGGWVDYERQTVFYNANGQDTAWIHESYNGTSFENQGKFVKSYNANGLVSSITTYAFDAGSWEKIAERKITYNGNQRSNDVIEADVMGTTIEIYKFNYIYANNKLDSMVALEIGSGTSLEPTAAHKFTIGADGGVDQIITHTKETSGWKYGYRTNFTGGTSGLKNISTINASVYPNPANELLNINVKSGASYHAQLVDLQGRVCFTANFNETIAVNVAQLNNGVYFLLLTDNQGNATQKRVVIAK